MQFTYPTHPIKKQNFFLFYIYIFKVNIAVARACLFTHYKLLLFRIRWEVVQIPTHLQNSLSELKEIRKKMPTGPDNHGTQDTPLCPMPIHSIWLCRLKFSLNFTEVKLQNIVIIEVKLWNASFRSFFFTRGPALRILVPCKRLTLTMLSNQLEVLLCSLWIRAKEINIRY